MQFRMIILTLLCTVLPGFGQNYLDVVRPFQGMSGRVGAGTVALPAAGTAGNALLGNPALLSYSEQASLAMDLNFDQFSSRSLFGSNIQDQLKDQQLKFNSISYIQPVRVYRGAWVWALSAQPVAEFGALSQFSDYDPDENFYYQYREQQSGALYAYSLASSLLATLQTSLGFSVSFLTGENNFFKTYTETDPQDLFTFSRYRDSLQFTPKYTGFSSRLGLIRNISETVHLGATLSLPAYLSVQESSSSTRTEWFDRDTVAQTSASYPNLQYAIWGPWSAGIGIGFTAAPLEASINYSYQTYTSSSFSSDLLAIDGGNLDDLIKLQIRDHLQNVHEFAASLGWKLDPLQLSMAASIRNDPLNYRLNNIIRLDVGLGYQFSSGLGFTVALRNEQGQSDLDHNLTSGVARTVAVQQNLTRFQLGMSYIL